jgi:hypothetical protein
MKKAFIVAALVTLTNLTYGQGDMAYTMFYSVGVPLGKTADFTENVSGRGFNMYFDYFVEDEFSLGFNAGIQTYYQDMGVITRTIDNVTGTGKVYRYLNQVPLLVTGKYHFDRFANITPHFGLGAGVIYNLKTIEFGTVQTETTSWQFSLQPELGLGLEMSPSTDFMFSVAYNQGTNTKDLDAMTTLVFNIGLRFAP